MHWANVFDVLGGIGLLLSLVVLYLLPILLAWARGHDQLTLISLITLLFGWTILGWVVALLWSITKVDPAAVAVRASIKAERSRAAGRAAGGPPPRS